MREFFPGEDDLGRRVDRILRRLLPHLPLTAIYRALRTGSIRVGGKRSKADQRLAPGQTISVHESLLADSAHPPANTQDNDGQNPVASLAGALIGPNAAPPFPLLYEGHGLMAFNKPAGIPVHGPSSMAELLVPWLQVRLPASLSFRPGPLHRLDQGTSGIVFFGTSREGAEAFSTALRERHTRKVYIALLSGELPSEQTWQDDLQRDSRSRTTRAYLAGTGKAALTRVGSLQSNKHCTLAWLSIHSGRTHQIRSQAAAHGHPLLADRKYGGPGEGYFQLHAMWLSLKLGDAEVEVFCPPPADFGAASAAMGFNVPPPTELKQLVQDGCGR